MCYYFLPLHSLTALCLTILLPPISTLFPYTTLFRSLTVLLVLILIGIWQLVASLPGVDLTLASPAQTLKAFRDDHALLDRKSTRLNSSHRCISYAVFCLKKKKYTNKIRCHNKPQHYT